MFLDGGFGLASALIIVVLIANSTVPAINISSLFLDYSQPLSSCWGIYAGLTPNSVAQGELTFSTFGFGSPSLGNVSRFDHHGELLRPMTCCKNPCGCPTYPQKHFPTNRTRPCHSRTYLFALLCWNSLICPSTSTQFVWREPKAKAQDGACKCTSGPQGGWWDGRFEVRLDFPGKMCLGCLLLKGRCLSGPQVGSPQMNFPKL